MVVRGLVGSDPAPVTYRFDTEGTYTFVCKFHADTMTGQVKVGNPPPPPPPPLSEQPFPNDQQPPTQLDVSDEKRPRLSRVRVAAVRSGARVRFRLSERARVTLRVKLAGITVRTTRRTFRAGAKAPECAGVIHSDFERGFIRAEVIHWDELLDVGSWSKARETGKLRIEGKDYEVQDGDVLEIRFNV